MMEMWQREHRASTHQALTLRTYLSDLRPSFLSVYPRRSCSTQNWVLLWMRRLLQSEEVAGMIENVLDIYEKRLSKSKYLGEVIYSLTDLRPHPLTYFLMISFGFMCVFEILYVLV